MEDVLNRLIGILDRAGVAGKELADFADEVLGVRNPETGLRDGNATASDTPADATDSAPATDEADATPDDTSEGNETTPAE